MKNQTKGLLLIIITETLLATLIVFLCIKAWNQRKELKEKERLIITVEEVFKSEQPEVISKYDFIDVQKAVYIEQLSKSLDIDSDLAFAILMTENPEFDENAIHKNENGTIDVGYFQMNDKYFWTTFRDAYWDFEDVEPDPFNWKHNTYMALHHIKYLQDRLKLIDEVIMAYNGGIGNVMNNTVKPSTYAYLAKVKNNMWLLKNYRDE